MSIPAPQEKELLIALRSGDQKAFEKIYQMYSPRLFGKLMKLVKSESNAKEILLDVFIIVWERRESIDTDKSFRSFLFKIAENKAFDFFRKAARDKVKQAELIALTTEDYIVIESFITVNENLQMLEKAIAVLPPQRQQVFRLCKLESKSYKEVGELLDISVSTISDHIVKGTKSIREYFEKFKTPMTVVYFLILQFL